KASDDLPEPDSPVSTTSLSRGMTTSMFFRLWTLAPFMTMESCAMLATPFWRPRPFLRLFRPAAAPVSPAVLPRRPPAPALQPKLAPLPTPAFCGAPRSHLRLQLENRVAQLGGSFELQRLRRFFHFLFEPVDERLPFLPGHPVHVRGGDIVGFRLRRPGRLDQVGHLLADRLRRDAVL